MMPGVCTLLRHALIGFLLLGLAACFGGDGSEGPDIHVVLIDRSGSIPPEDREIYVRSLEGIAGELAPGGRVLLGEIGDADRSNFRPLLDIRAENSNIRLEREENLVKARAELAAAVPALLPEKPLATARSTRILETVAAAAEAFSMDAKGGRLFILSDGVEEGQVVNLARMHPDPAAIAKALEAARKQALLPDLGGVELFIIGAGGDGTAMGVPGIRAFWEAYAKATGARSIRIGRLPYQGALPPQ